MPRTLIGALLFLILVGELTVGAHSGLFSLGGIIVFCLLYFTYFLLIDALVAARQLTNLQLVFINFALYSVLITGFLHGEIQNYALHPHQDLITTLIRLQSAVYPVFAYQLLQRWYPLHKSLLPVPKAVLVFVGFIIIMSLTGRFGLAQTFDTFRIAPAYSIVFGLLGIIALLVGLQHKSKPKSAYSNPRLRWWSVAFVILGCVPVLPSFIILLILELIVGLYYTFNIKFRQAVVAPLSVHGVAPGSAIARIK